MSWAGQASHSQGQADFRGAGCGSFGVTTQVDGLSLGSALPDGLKGTKGVHTARKSAESAFSFLARVF